MTIDTLIKKFREWVDSTAKASLNLSSRGWCLLGFNKQLTQSDIATYFDRTDLNSKFVSRYSETNPDNKLPHSYIQAEINMVYSLHKSFVTRHKSRLQCYRDDCSQKSYHMISAVNIGYAKFLSDQDSANKVT